MKGQAWIGPGDLSPLQHQGAPVLVCAVPRVETLYRKGFSVPERFADG
jgi:hypothetical protein